jgi:glycerophosphoryl diester phosphodiesterase
LAAGADGSEVDVRRSSDGGLVCVHDPVAGGRPVIAQSTKELAAIGVFALADVVAAAAGGRLIIEVKNDSHEPDFSPDASSATLLAEVLEGLIGAPGAATQDVVVSSFDTASVRAAAAAGWPAAFLSPPRMSLTKGLARARRAGCSELHAHVSVIAASRSVASVRADGLSLVAWTVTTGRQARRLERLGIDGVICDDPAGVVAALPD